MRTPDDPRPRSCAGALAGRRTPTGRMLPFARLLVESPDREAIGRRLVTGHHADPEGLCRHVAHEWHPETYPCTMVRAVALADRLAAG